MTIARNVWFASISFAVLACALFACPPTPSPTPPGGCIQVGETCKQDSECCTTSCRKPTATAEFGKCDLPVVHCKIATDCLERKNFTRTCDQGICVWTPIVVTDCGGQPDGAACTPPPRCYTTGKCQAGSCVGDQPAGQGSVCAGGDPCFQWVCNGAGACNVQTAATPTSPCECTYKGSCINSNICFVVAPSQQCRPGLPNPTCPFCINPGKAATTFSDCYGNGAICK